MTDRSRGTTEDGVAHDDGVEAPRFDHGAPRSVALDGVRVVGIVAIVVGHVWGTGLPERLTYAWHVPVFFFLTGWLWREERGVRQEVASRSRTLVVPYLAWLVAIGIPVTIYLATGHGSVDQEFRDAVYGGRYLTRPFTAFWFVSALFALCLVRRLVSRLSLPTVTVLAVALWIGSYPLAEPLSETPGSVGIALPALVFLVAGEWARRFSGRLPAPGIVGSVAIAAPLVLVATDVVRPVNLKVGELGTPVAGYLVALSVSFGLVLLAQKVEGRMPARARSVTTLLASVGLPVILVHSVFLYILSTPGSGRWPDFVVAVVASWALALAVRRTPLGAVLISWPAPARPALHSAGMRTSRRSGRQARPSRRRPGSGRPPQQKSIIDQ